MLFGRVETLVRWLTAGVWVLGFFVDLSVVVASGGVASELSSRSRFAALVRGGTFVGGVGSMTTSLLVVEDLEFPPAVLDFAADFPLGTTKGVFGLLEAGFGVHLSFRGAGIVG